MPIIDEVYDDEAELKRLAAILEPRYRRMLNAVHEAIRLAFGMTVDDFRLTDAQTNLMLVEGARQVVRINETTRQAINEQLRIGQELGLSTFEIAQGNAKIGYRGVDGLYRETWKGRAQTIARTELQHAQIVSAYQQYAATGLVDRVKLVDGDDDALCAPRNGKVVPLGDRPPLMHPNCTLGLIPVFREGVLPPSRSARAALPKPPPASPVWGDWSTVEEAQAAAAARYPHIEFGLDGMHLDTVKPILKQFAVLAEDYPYAANALRYVGTYPPGLRAEKFDNNTYAHATGWGVGRTSFEGPRIAFNATWFGDPSKLQKQLDADERTKWHPTGSASPEFVLTHEFGHVVDHTLQQMHHTAAIPYVSGTTGSGLVHDTFYRWFNKYKATKTLSRYSAKSPTEGWAEAFAAQYHSPAAVKKIKYVQKQRELLNALAPANLTNTYEVIDMSTPQPERTDKLHFIHQWTDRLFD